MVSLLPGIPPPVISPPGIPSPSSRARPGTNRRTLLGMVPDKPGMTGKGNRSLTPTAPPAPGQPPSPPRGTRRAAPDAGQGAGQGTGRRYWWSGRGGWRPPRRVRCKSGPPAWRSRRRQPCWAWADRGAAPFRANLCLVPDGSGGLSVWFGTHWPDNNPGDRAALGSAGRHGFSRSNPAQAGARSATHLRFVNQLRPRCVGS